MKIENLKQILSTDQAILLDQWIFASKEYYSGEAMMADTTFDELTETLIGFEIPELTQFIESTIYTEKNGDEGEMIEVSPDTQEMVSLKKQKYKDKSSVVEIKKYFGQRNLMYAPKFDGASLKITWNPSFQFVDSIISRGGIDVTNNFRNHPDIIKTRIFKKHIVCGELLCPKTTFNNKYSVENGGDYENARNFVGGLIKVHNIEKSIVVDLHFQPCTDGTNPLGDNWKPVTSTDLYNLEIIIALYKSDDFAYLCDGIVLAFEEPGQRQIKNNYPLNMLAIKFKANRVQTKVIGFEWTQKKKGHLTPKILIEHVKLDGSTMTCANGYNYQWLVDAHIGIGSIVEIEKSGDIIPVIAKVLTYSNHITMPIVDFTRQGKHLMAVDQEISRKYKFILGIKNLNIDGIGDTLADQIGQVVNYNILDIFNPINKPGICDSLGGGKSWQKFSQIYAIKRLPLDLLIILHQFNGVGPVLAKKIALLLLKKSTDSANISDDVMMNVCRGEGFQRIIASIKFLKNHNIAVITPVEMSDDAISFEMTTSNASTSIAKDNFIKQFKELYPNSFHTTLTKETKYLFCDDLSSNSGKINKARKYNIKIVLYSEALKGNLN